MKTLRNWIGIVILAMCVFEVAVAAKKGIRWQFRPGEGKLNVVKDLKRLSVLSHAHVPKGIFVSLLSQTYYDKGNDDFVSNLYDIIYRINKRDGLLQSDHGKEQKIDFVVTGDSIRLQKLVKKIHKRIKTEDALDYFVPIVTKNLFDRWFQDWGEFVGVGESEEGDLVYGIYYVNRNRDLKGVVKEIAKRLGVPFITSESYTGATGNYGGNIEVTPDGILYYGNTMDRDQWAQLERLGNQDRMVSLRTDWLSVGHVDETMTTIPSNHTCRYPDDYEGPEVSYSHVLADPILGLQTIYNYKGKQKYISYSSNDFREARYYFTSLKRAIGHYLKSKRQMQVFMAKDFHPTSKSCYQDHKISSKYCDLVEFNIWAKDVLENNIERLTVATPCENDDVIRIPQIYRFFLTAYGAEAVSFLPGTANMVVLRNNVIVPTPTFDGPGGFAPIIQKTLDEKLGGGEDRLGDGVSRVYFIDVKREYHDLLGEVHCGTNVMREPTLVNMDYP